MPSWLPEGNTSLASDSEQRSLWKIVDTLNTGGGGAGSAYGVGSPEGVVTGTQGKLYTNAAGEIWQKASAGSGNTGWVPLLQ